MGGGPEPDGPLFECGRCDGEGCRLLCHPRWHANSLFSVSSSCVGPGDRTACRLVWLVWRFLLFGVFLAGLIGAGIQANGDFLVYYTNYSYCIETACVFLLLVNTLVSFCLRDRWESMAPVSTILFGISVSHSATVLLLYWALLRTSLNWTTFFVHMANFVALTIDAIFNRIRLIPLQFVFPLIVMVIYIVYACIYQAVSGQVIYPGYTNFDNPGLLTGLVFALLLLNTLFFALFLALSYVTHSCGGDVDEQYEADIELTTMKK